MADASPSAPVDTGKLVIQIMDVGQGDAIYIEFPNGKNMLVDFGSTKGRTVATPDARKYLQTHTRFREPGATLDYLVITHADADHYNQLKQFFETLKPKVRFLLFGGNWDDYPETVRVQLKSVVGTILKPPKVRPFGFEETAEIGEPNRFKLFGQVEVLVLAANVDGTSRSDEGWKKNSASLVLQLKYGGRSVMLAGDATFDTEREIIKTFDTVGRLGRQLLRSEVLKVGHHGSARTSTGPAWISAVKPEFVFISSDRHGSLDEHEDSGHRLPQELCIDLIRQYSKLAPALEHPYVSSYDPADYTGFVDPGTGKAAPLVPDVDRKPTLLRRQGEAPFAQWYQARTTEAIFTTLAEMDARSPLAASAADQGVQYEIVLTRDGAISVNATMDLQTVIPVSAKK